METNGKPDYKRIQDECRKRSHRILKVTDKMLVPGAIVRMVDRTEYEIKTDGSWRKVRKS